MSMAQEFGAVEQGGSEAGVRQVDDQQLAWAVERAIDRITSRPRPVTFHLQVRVQVFGGVVSLSGVASSLATRWAVGEAALRVAGARTVLNQIRLLPAGRTDRSFD